jgi:cytochrome c
MKASACACGVLALSLALPIALGGCGNAPQASQVPDGDAARGRLLLRQYGCGSCHRIPGVAAATGNVGPPLERWARRIYIAGVLPNTPDNLVRWIVDPQAVEPGTAMPDLQVSDAQARDMAAYLHGLD